MRSADSWADQSEKEKPSHRLLFAFGKAKTDVLGQQRAYHSDLYGKLPFERFLDSSDEHHCEPLKRQSILDSDTFRLCGIQLVKIES